MIPEAVSQCKEWTPHWWQWHPPVGVFIAALALLGVIVPWFRGDAGKREKAFWTFVMFLFVGLEIRTIYLDQAEHDQQQAFARCQQLESFQTIAGGIGTAIGQSQQQFQATMQKSDAITKGLTEAIEIETGNGSYVYMMPEFQLGEIEVKMWGKPQRVLEYSAIEVFKGRYPLHDVHVNVTDRFGSQEIGGGGTVYPSMIGHAPQEVKIRLQPDADRQEVMVFVTSSGGPFSQRILFLRKIASTKPPSAHFVWASRIYKGNPNKFVGVKPIDYMRGQGFSKADDSQWDKP
jgi:hypothetical protein